MSPDERRRAAMRAPLHTPATRDELDRYGDRVRAASGLPLADFPPLLPVCDHTNAGHRCEAVPNHDGSHVAAHSVTGEPVFWGPGLGGAA